MLTQHNKRALSLLMAVAMVISIIPVQTLASETEPDSHNYATEIPISSSPTADVAVPVETILISEEGEDLSNPVTESEPVTESSAAIIVEPTETIPETTANTEYTVTTHFQAKINDILSWYLGTTQMSTSDIYAAVFAMEEDIYWNALVEFYDFENSEDLLQLSENEAVLLAQNNPTFCGFGSALYERRSKDDSISFFAATVSLLDSQITITDTANSMSESSGTVTITASGGLFSQTTNNITITNSAATTATLSFDYSASNYKSFSQSSARCQWCTECKRRTLHLCQDGKHYYKRGYWYRKCTSHYGKCHNQYQDWK